MSPTLYENQTSTVKAYFPEGRWLSAFAPPITGPTHFDIPIDDEWPNIALRFGYIIPVQDFAPTITEQRNSPFDLIVLIDPKNSRAEGELYWDDGITSNAPYNHVEFGAYLRSGNTSYPGKKLLFEKNLLNR